MRYEFEFDEINCCSNCPFYYDFMVCLIDDEKREHDEYTWEDDGKRPNWCKLIERSF